MDATPTTGNADDDRRDGNLCHPRERLAALSAIALALVIGVTIVVLSLRPASERVVGVQAGGATAPGPANGAGHGGTGTGTGAGDGAGSGTGGKAGAEGPGASDAATATTTTGGAAPPADEAARAGAAGPGPEAPAAGQGQQVRSDGGEEVLRVGFTASDDPPGNPPATQPVGPDVPGAAGEPGGGGIGFMGVPIQGRRVVFVVDRSSSMRGDRFDATRGELRRAILGLPGDASFGVVMFSAAPPSGGRGFVVMPPGRLSRASPASKRAAQTWLSGVSIDEAGGSQAVPAMREALRMGADTVFLLSDGGLDDGDALEEVLRAGNTAGRTRIHVIALQNPAGERLMRRLAADHGGTFRLVEKLPEP